MKVTKIGRDIVSVNEDNLGEYKKNIGGDKIHIVKLSFFNPTSEKINKVISMFDKTNRFVIEDNIKTYNYILKYTNKKYYVQNTKDVGIISFFRKNNKVLLDFTRLVPKESQYLLSYCFEDILKNLEIILIDNDTFNEKFDLLELWNGNVIVSNDGETI